MDYKTILFLICTVVIFSYLFDLIARKTRFPSVILLIGLGLSLCMLADYYGYSIPYLDEILPSLGKIGLILIVLEGALELRITRAKQAVILQGFLSALVLLLVTTFALAYLFYHYLDIGSFRLSLIYAIPLSVISSAVAIPSASGMPENKREFVVYESTFSDILGIIFFNFALNNQVYDAVSFTKLGLQTLVIFILSIAIAYFLLALINRIEHHVQFFLILSMLIIFYLIGDRLQLSSLIIIFFFGLAMSNLKAMVPKSLRKYTEHLRKSEEELHRFHLLSAESAFLVRTFFFLVFGFSINLQNFAHIKAYKYALAILLLIFFLRFLYLYLVGRKKLIAEGFIAPRGLISILLFLSIPPDLKAGLVLDGNFLLLIILGSMLVMMYGNLRFNSKRLERKALEKKDEEERRALSKKIDRIDEQTKPLPGYGKNDSEDDSVG